MMGQCYLPHDKTGGEQHIISVVETQRCYHTRKGSIRCAIPIPEKVAQVADAMLPPFPARSAMRILAKTIFYFLLKYWRLAGGTGVV
jgi:hypothetical protein